MLGLRDVGLAGSLFEESLALWRESGDQKAVARSLSNLATIAKLQATMSARVPSTRSATQFSGTWEIETGVAWSLNYQDVAA